MSDVPRTIPALELELVRRRDEAAQMFGELADAAHDMYAKALVAIQQVMEWDGEREDAEPVAPVTPVAHDIQVELAEAKAIIAALNPWTTAPKPLVAWRADGTATLVVTQ